MKFVKLKKHPMGYMQMEFNNDIVALLGTFLVEDVYKDTKSYLDWLYSIVLPSYEGGYGKEHVNLEPAGNVINLIPNWKLYYDDDEEMLPPDLAIRYSATREELIDLIKKWDEIISKEPRPENIVVIQDNNNEIHIESISDDDPRFSRIINGQTLKPFAKIQKSKIFEDYYQVEANTHSYLSLGMLFSDYTKRKETILEWFNNQEIEPTSPDTLYYTNFGTFYKRNDTICATVQIGQELKNCKFCYPMRSSNLLQLFEQWDQILKKDPFPKEVLIYEKNGKMIMEERN